MDTPNPSAPGSPDSAAIPPQKPAAALAPGATPDSPGGQPPQTGDDKRVADAQSRMHQATTEAAETRKDNERLAEEVERLSLENSDLKSRLGGLFNQTDRYSPLEEPKEVAFGGTEIKQLWEDYSKQGEDEAAFGLMATRILDMADQRYTNRTERERIKAENTSRRAAFTKAIREQVSDVVTREAPDVDLDLFWAYAAPIAERECPPSLTDPLQRFQWQAERAVELVRKKTGSRAPKAGDPNPETIRRSAASIIPGGSLTPRPGGTPGAPQRMSMVDQMRARQAKILPGMTR